MDDNKDNAPVVSTDDMLTELNLDTTEENNEVVSGLIQDAQSIILSSFNSNLSASELKSDRIYIRAVKALVTAMYYDRSLSQGVPLGVKMMITHLQGRYDQWPEE